MSDFTVICLTTGIIVNAIILWRLSYRIRVIVWHLTQLKLAKRGQSFQQTEYM